MPAFFFLSGLLAWSSVNKDKKRFFFNISKHIAYPYFLWGTVQMLIMNVFSNYLNNPTPFNPLEFFSLISGSPAQFWFLKILYLIHVTYLLIIKYSNAYSFLLISIALPSIAILPVPANVSQFATSVVFYGLGVLLAKEGISLPAQGRFQLILIGLFGALWLFLTGVVQKLDIPSFREQALSGFLPAAITGSFFVFTLSRLKYIESNKLLLYLGKRTLAIFCLHVLFVAGTRIILAKFFGVTAAGVILPAAIFAGLAGPLAITAIAERFRLRPMLGLG